MRAVRAIVRGRVHGVGFRYATERTAERLDVAGWVRNRPDGSVEVWAQGPDDELARLAGFLQLGPAAAVVTSVETEDVDPDPTLTGFDIRF
jgi:acylphosphatase